MDQHFVRQLGEAFGTDKVHVRTQYHLQVDSPRGPHNIWDGKDGFKIQLAGQKNVQRARQSRIIEFISKYQPANTDMGRMEAALALSNLVKRAIRVMNLSNSQSGVFVDAGFKNGMAKIAAIFVCGDRISAESFVESHPNSTAAEIAAIKFGLAHFLVKPPPMIFSDCQSAVSMVGNPRVHWIRRGNNVADKIGNLRSSANA